MSITRVAIDPTLSVNEIIRRYPASISILNAHGIDTCCGGGNPLRAGALEAHANLGALLDQIAEAAATTTEVR
jgi:iron-sulfur cluster repair protein YtfE (RIC family)